MIIQDKDSKLENIVISDGLVPVTDDPFLPGLTLRVLVIGTLWTVFLSVCNVIFSFRTTSFELPIKIVTLLSYPMGIFASKFLPRRKINILGSIWELNPGDFSIKEHVLVYIIASGIIFFM